VEIEFENLSNELELWVDVVWSKEHPLGLGAQRFVNEAPRLLTALRSV